MIDLRRHELIGRYAEVVDSANKDNVGIKGLIRNETKNTITIEGKKLLKKQVVLAIKVDNKVIKIKGEDILKRPEDRIKVKKR